MEADISLVVNMKVHLIDRFVVIQRYLVLRPSWYASLVVVGTVAVVQGSAWKPAVAATHAPRTGEGVEYSNLGDPVCF